MISRMIFCLALTISFFANLERLVELFLEAMEILPDFFDYISNIFIKLWYLVTLINLQNWGKFFY